jgi:uncharacterized membrane protein
MPEVRQRPEGTRRGIGNRVAPARFILFGSLTIIAVILGSIEGDWQHGGLIGFDVGATAFLLSLTPLLKDCGTLEMRRLAAQNNPNRITLLFIAAIVMVVVLIAVAVELAQKGNPPAWQLALIMTTLALVWLFTNTIYALHYADMYYLRDSSTQTDSGGIRFPGTKEPDYWDFMYFAFSVGMTFQTSDSNITSGKIRRVVTLHSLTAFVFSISVIAFSINVLGAAGGGAGVVIAH